MKKQTICLNMIVKDEAHIIAETLEKLWSKVPVDYWVISDTGSTDDTPQIIKKFFAEKNVPGELYHHEWQDFATNRNLAIQKAQNKADYILIFDADDEIVGDFQLPFLQADSYNFQFLGSGVYYQRCLLVNGRLDWQWYGVLHEYIGNPLNTSHPHRTQDFLSGNYYVNSGRLGSRNLDPQKYLKDAQILEKAFETETDIGLKGRYAYYCGQSYRDCKMYDKAYDWYKKCTEITTWDEEAYSAEYFAADCMKLLGKATLFDLQNQYFLAWMRRPTRVEAMFDLAMIYKNMQKHHQAYALLKICATAERPFEDRLFVNSWVYDGASLDEFSIAAYWAGKYDESAVACNRLIESGKYQGDALSRIQKNLWYAEKALGKFSSQALEEYTANAILELESIKE